ncbi:MAG: response regulator transcription factor [Bdellovibrionaceae bacterium]|nr:response regulator transcription factor [Pseudobdellovibrionaceae bacterium]
MTARILLVDDAPEIQFLVRRTLDNRFLVESAGTLEEARKALAKGLFDLVLLDVVLPDGNGFEFFEEMRPSLGETPVLFLTGVNDMDNKVNAFRRGADDYLVKPVDPRELQARVEARLAKRGRSPEITFGELKVNLDHYEVSLTGNGSERPVDLTPHELKILIRLVQNRGRVLSRNQLIDEAWGAGVHVEERTVDKHVSSLRKKIGDASSYVKTVPGFGYMFSTERDEEAN